MLARTQPRPALGMAKEKIMSKYIFRAIALIGILMTIGISGCNQSRMNKLTAEYSSSTANVVPNTPVPKDKFAKWVTNDNQELTKADFDKTLAKCKYEVHKATIGREPPTYIRNYISTTDTFYNSMEELKELHSDIEILNFEVQKQLLFEECIKLGGYVLHSSKNNMEDIEMVSNACPEKTEDWCFIE